MSNLRVNSITPATGTNVAIGTAGGSITYNTNVSGVSTFSNGIVVSAGTTAAPSIIPSGDSNTGIFFPSADTVAVSYGGTEALRVDNSGKILGATSLSWVGTATSTSLSSVIQRGSTSNGNYIRYADGTQICWKYAVTTYSAADQNVFSATWTFPIAFSAVPNVIANTDCTDVAQNYFAFSQCRETSTTSTILYAFKNQVSGTFNLNGTAIGRWY